MSMVPNVRGLSNGQRTLGRRARDIIARSFVTATLGAFLVLDLDDRLPQYPACFETKRFTAVLPLRDATSLVLSVDLGIGRSTVRKYCQEAQTA